MAVTKPSIQETDIWAANAAEASKEKPDSSKVESGFIFGEKPPHKDFNWYMNIVSSMLVHMQQNGIPGWDPDTYYQPGALVMVSGKMYTAKVANDGHAPATSPTEWKPYSTSTEAPVGSIVAYGGAFSDIPDNWSLCNGTGGTPDLTARFIYGTGVEDSIGDTGGSRDAVVISHDHSASFSGHALPGHRHTVPEATSGDFAGNYRYGRGGSHVTISGSASMSSTSAGTPSGSVSVNKSGTSGSGKNLPPYVKMAYIMRMY